MGRHRPPIRARYVPIAFWVSALGLVVLVLATVVSVVRSQASALRAYLAQLVSLAAAVVSTARVRARQRLRSA